MALEDQVAKLLEVADDEVSRIMLRMRIHAGVLGHFQGSPTPVIESMAIAFLNNNVRDHSLTLTNAGELVIDLDLNVFPNSDELTVTWRSSNA